MSVVPSENGGLVTVSLPATWLADPARVFPVSVDPSVWIDSNADTYVSQRNPTTKYGSSTTLSVGKEPTYNYYSSAFVKFDVAGCGMPTDAYPDNTTFQVWDDSGSTAESIGIGRTRVTGDGTDSWSEANTSWNTSQPGEAPLCSATIPTTSGWVKVIGDAGILGAARDWWYDSLAPTHDPAVHNDGFKLFWNATPNIVRTLHSRENANYPPRLGIGYTVPSVGLSASQTTVAANDSDAVTATVTISTNRPDDVSHVHLHDAGADFVWDDGSTLDTATYTYTGGGAGQFGYNTAGSASKVTPLTDRWSITTGTAGCYATFVWRVKPGFGDVPNNSLQAEAQMGGPNRWAGAATQAALAIVPEPVSGFNYGYLDPVDQTIHACYEGDGGDNDTPDASGDVTRAAGYVNLDWKSAGQTAAGYKVMLHDGDTWQQIGYVQGSNSTTYTTQLQGIYPTASEIASLSSGFTGNPFWGASTPGPSSLQASVSTTLGSAGVILTDGTYLYVRAWGNNSGPTYWTRIGTGHGGTVAGANYGQIGKDFSSRPILSGFLLKGVLYNGYATSATTIEGVSTTATKDSTTTTTLEFSKPLLNKSTGSEITSATNSILLTSDGTYIYSIADTNAGYLVRAYNNCGGWNFDQTIAAPHSNTSNVFTDGTWFYFMEWTGDGKAHVTRAVGNDFPPYLTPWRVENRWTIDQDVTRVIGGCMDATNNVFWLGRADGAGTIYRYAPRGIDLRDDPASLYAKMGAGLRTNQTHYEFKVVAVNSSGDGDISAAPIYRATIPNFTATRNDDPRHAPVGLPEMAHHAASYLVDKRALQLSVTDLQVASWGPEADLSRVYDSSVTSSTYFAPGWRFNFEQSLVPSGTDLIYVDAADDQHRFTQSGGAYVAPNGFHGSLVATGTGWTITDFQDHTALHFGPDYRMATESDSDGNTVSYVWIGNHLTIGAANGQSVEVTLSAGRVSSAEYATAAGKRDVSYVTGGTTSTVTYSSGSADDHEVDYGYSGSQLSELYVPSFNTSGTVAARWDFLYYACDGSLEEVHLPGYSAPTGPAYTLTSNSVTDPDGVEWYYAVNFAGAMVFKEHQKGAYTDYLYRYYYSPTNDLEYTISPMGNETRAPIDLFGNKLYDIDPLGDTTSYAYDSSNRLAAETSPRGAVTSYTYKGTTSDIATQTQQLTSDGTTNGVAYTYNASGTVTSESKTTTSPGVFVTTAKYGNFAPNGEAQVTTVPSVVLDPAQPPVDVVTTQSFDAFGDKLGEKDANGIVTESDTYSPSGLLITSTDASGVVAGQIYDILGDEIESSRTAGDGTFADWTTKIYDPDGNLLRENRYSARGVIDHYTTHTYDLAGRETTVVDSVAGTTTKSYDWLGNLASVDPPVQGPATYTYDDDFRETAETPAGSNLSKTISYDAAGRETTVTEVDGSWTASAYDADGNTISETKPSGGGGTTTDLSTYDLGGRLTTEIQDAYGTPSESDYTYDFAGDQLTAGLKGNASSSSTYNVEGWALTQTDQDSVTTTSTYDAAGRKISDTAVGKTTTYGFDGAGRMTRQVNPDGSVDEFQPDAFGRTIAETQTVSGGVVKRILTSYDALGRTNGTTDTISQVRSTSAYAADTSKVSTATLAYGSVPTTITYDAAGYETARQTTTSTASITRTVTARDAAARVIAWSASVPGTSAVLAGTMTFDGAGRVSAQGGHGFASSGATYTFDPDTGLKTSESIALTYPATTWSDSFAYTSDGRLSSASIGTSTTNYTYDPGGAGNIIRSQAGSSITTLTYDSCSRLTNVKTNGANVSVTTSATTGVRTQQGSITYSWDNSLHLVHYFNATSSINATLTYDANGQRTSSIVTSGTGAAACTTSTTYTYDDNDIKLLSLSGTETVAGSVSATYTIVYLYDENSCPYAAVYYGKDCPSPKVLQLVTDDRGDVVELLTDTGVAFARYRYDAWGNPIATTSPSRDASCSGGSLGTTLAANVYARQPLRYGGYCYDSFSGLYYLSERYYDPRTMQFLSKDPVGDDAEGSVYQYCENDPVDNEDGSGLVDTRTYEKHLNCPGVEGKYCWSGCLESICRHFNVKKWDENRIVKYVLHCKNAYHDYGGGQIGLYPGALPKVLHKMKFKCRGNWVTRPLTRAEVFGQIKRGYVIMALMFWVSDSDIFYQHAKSHYILVDGYKSKWNKTYHQRDVFYDYMDPYYGRCHHNISDYWVTNESEQWAFDDGTAYWWQQSVQQIRYR